MQPSLEAAARCVSVWGTTAPEQAPQRPPVVADGLLASLTLMPLEDIPRWLAGELLGIQMDFFLGHWERDINWLTPRISGSRQTARRSDRSRHCMFQVPRLQAISSAREVACIRLAR